MIREMTALTLSLLIGASALAEEPPVAQAQTDVAVAPLAASVMLAGLQPTDAASAADAYGGDIRFDVMRRGKRVGKHVTRFYGSADGEVRARSEMEIKIKALFVTVFRFNYTSDAVLGPDGLTAIESGTGRGKKAELNKGERVGDDFTWIRKDGDGYTVPAAGLYSTDHWNPAVLTQNRVFNTITGKINSIKIEPVGYEMVETGTGPRRALKVQYSGDLDSRAWYDEQGRWVGLEFEAQDGSTIRYVCTQCGGIQS